MESNTTDNILHYQSSNSAILFNLKPLDMLYPWHLYIDVKKRRLIVKKRNWHFVGYDEEIFALKSVRNVKVDTHIFGADITIKFLVGEVQIFFLTKQDAKKIRDILINNDWDNDETDIILDGE